MTPKYLISGLSMILWWAICVTPSFSFRCGAQGLWSQDGNFIGPGQFLGGTNFAVLELRVSGLPGWRIEPDPRDGGIAANLIGGATNNLIEQPGSGGDVIVGGGWIGGTNVIHTNTSGAFIGAGSANEIGPNLNDGVIGGGYGNRVQAFNGFIGSGYFNSILPGGGYSSIGGGQFNTNNAFAGSIGGGIYNSIQTNANYSTIAGGPFNLIQSNSVNCTIGGGYFNVSGGYSSTVPGGYFNSALGFYSLAAGQQANALHQGAFVWADSQTQPFSSSANDQFSIRAQGGVRLVTGGAGLTLDGVSLPMPRTTVNDANHSNIVNVVNGSTANSAGSVYGATIAGGGAQNYFGAAGLGNSVNADFGTVSGGVANNSSGVSSSIGGGSFNSSSGASAVVAGGSFNLSSGANATVIGGSGNTASGDFSTVPGGNGNSAVGDFSFAAGRNAQANHAGAFVWADSQGSFISSATSNQFLIRASGGVGIGTNNPQGALEVVGNWNGENGALRLTGDRATIRMNSGAPAGNQTWLIHVGSDGPGNLAFYRRTGTASYQYTMGIRTNGNVGIGLAAPTNKLHVAGGVSATAFISTSDRNAKTNFAPVNAREVLDKVASLPISTWTFKDMPDGPHMGPMAQDFHAAFGLGGSDTTIATVDPDGVALAAIQGLNQKLEEKETEIHRLEQRLERVERMLQERGSVER